MCDKFQFPEGPVLLSCLKWHHDYNMPPVNAKLPPEMPELSFSNFSGALHKLYEMYSQNVMFANQCIDEKTIDGRNEALAGMALGGFIGKELSQPLVEGVIQRLGYTLKECTGYKATIAYYLGG